MIGVETGSTRTRMQRHRLMTAWTLAVLVCAGVGVGAKGPPVNAAPPGPARLVGRRGRSVRFVCPLRADPEPIVEWYRVSIDCSLRIDSTAENGSWTIPLRPLRGRGRFQFPFFF